MSGYRVIDDRGRTASRHRTQQAAERAIHRLERETSRMAQRGMGGGYATIHYAIQPPAVRAREEAQGAS